MLGKPEMPPCQHFSLKEIGVFIVQDGEEISVLESRSRVGDSRRRGA